MESETRARDVDDKTEGGYKSPRRILLRFFRQSRNRWKEKCKTLKKDVKRSENRARDAQKSRDGWREKAERWKAEAEASKAEIARLQEELAASRAEAVKKGARNFLGERLPAAARRR
jgi:chromosome segregation ATPase